MMGNSFPPTRMEQVGLLELVLRLPALLRPSGALSVFICTTGVQQQRSGQLKGGQERWPTGMASRRVEDRSHRRPWCQKASAVPSRSLAIRGRLGRKPAERPEREGKPGTQVPEGGAPWGLRSSLGSSHQGQR